MSRATEPDLETQFATWIGAYQRAWIEGDADAAAALFTEDGIYRSAPHREPHVGRAEIRRYWREEPCLHDHVDLRFGEPIVEGRRVAVEWWAIVTQGGVQTTGPGCLVLRFDRRGLCEELREYWSDEPGVRLPPDGWGH